ncbi:uncharacterized protein A4U43_C04F1170 [Asparagus officinalis]|uniref:Uncharacterized protein n=1 Tax=Asparagus officinalis TaxID=4686 RepID=A0A5P1EZ56_ASPOF|nr:uncharacterized protein A4U43_C04F1170 [Asparagus officinalis]
MDAEKLRENAHKMVDFIADYYKSLESYPVLSQVKPGYLRELLPHSAPDLPESLQDVLDDIRQKIIPDGYFCYLFWTWTAKAQFMLTLRMMRKKVKKEKKRPE